MTFFIKPSFPFVSYFSFLFLLLVLLLQFIVPQLRNIPTLLGEYGVVVPTRTSTTIGQSAPTSVCPNLQLFPTQPPFSKSYRMALLQEAKRVGAEFEYSPDDVRKGVKEFIRQMG